MPGEAERDRGRGQGWEHCMPRRAEYDRRRGRRESNPCYLTPAACQLCAPALGQPLPSTFCPCVAGTIPLGDIALGLLATHTIAVPFLPRPHTFPHTSITLCMPACCTIRTQHPHPPRLLLRSSLVTPATFSPARCSSKRHSRCWKKGSSWSTL